LEKDLDIVALTSARWGQKIFRDFRSALKLANLLVWTKGDERPKSFGRPMVKMRIELPSAQEDGAKYLLVTGLADGNQARLAMEKAGYLIQRHLTFPDHARYALAVMDSILEDVKRQGLKLALTGKDWVKWRSYIVEKGLESMVRVLEPELRLDPHDEKIWSQVLWER
jgi:tetraacyldisaccharide-1-P 4'-kinase